MSLKIKLVPVLSVCNFLLKGEEQAHRTVKKMSEIIVKKEPVK